jgi:PAS domain S-box-containing protein
LGIVFATAINDTAVAIGLYPFIYLREYGYTAVIFMMAYSIWNTVIEAARTKDTLAESEERFRSIVEYYHSGILTVDNNFQFTYVNDQLCNILGYSREELIGKDFRSFLNDESEERLADRLVRQRRGDTIPVRYEMSIIRKDGSKRLLEMSSATTVGSAGYVSMISQALDITERKKIELALAQRAIENVQLYEQAQQRAEQLATLNEINRAVSSLKVLDTVLEIIYQQVQRITKAVDLVHGQIQNNGVHVHIADNMASVYGDRARLLEIVQNLVDNAVKFMGNQIEPHIEIGQDGTDSLGKPIFFVQDNGIGIEPQHHERIFGLFNKLDAQTEGTGIGLALVKRIVEVHGGRVWVESEGAGKGTKFLFTLPQHDDNMIKPSTSN